MIALESCCRVRFLAPVKSAPLRIAPLRSAPSKSAPRKTAFVASTLVILAPRSDAPLRFVRLTKAPCKSRVLAWVTSLDLSIGFSQSASKHLHDFPYVDWWIVISIVDSTRSQVSLKKFEDGIRKIREVLRDLP